MGWRTASASVLVKLPGQVSRDAELETSWETLSLSRNYSRYYSSTLRAKYRGVLLNCIQYSFPYKLVYYCSGAILFSQSAEVTTTTTTLSSTVSMTYETLVYLLFTCLLSARVDTSPTTYTSSKY